MSVSTNENGLAWQLWTLGAAHAGTGPDQSLSGPPQGRRQVQRPAQRRGEPLGEAEVGCGSWRVQERQGNIVLLIFLIGFD